MGDTTRPPLCALAAVLRELGEAPSSEQDIVSPDAAELAALELGKVALVARDGASLDADAVPRPGGALVGCACACIADATCLDFQQSPDICVL